MGSIWTAARFAFGTLLLAVNTIVHVPVLMIAALMKALMPWRRARRFWNAVLMAIAAGLLVLAVLPSLRKKRDEVFVESEN